jgi:hypothetical protein
MVKHEVKSLDEDSSGVNYKGDGPYHANAKNEEKVHISQMPALLYGNTPRGCKAIERNICNACPPLACNLTQVIILKPPPYFTLI